MNKIDLIIDALGQAYLKLYSAGYSHLIADSKDSKLIVKALDAARELKALKPVGYMDSKGVLFNHTTHPHLNTPLYALDEVKHD